MEPTQAEKHNFSRTEEEILQTVTFLLSGAEFGVGIRQAREIIRLVEMTKMPKSPFFMEGILNLRSRIIPVLNLGKRFGFPAMEASDENRIIVAEAGGQLLGLLVDKVLGVVKIPRSSISITSGEILGVPAGYLSGAAQVKGRTILLFDLERLLNLAGIKSPVDSDPKQPEKGMTGAH